MFARFDEIPTMTLQDIKETQFYGRMCCHLELQREITSRINYWPLALFFYKSICLVDMNMFARFDEIPTTTLQDIKEKNVTDGHCENSIIN